MKCSVIQSELLNYAIDGKAATLPLSIQSHVDSCPECKREWANMSGWVNLLQSKEKWQPEGNFIDVLVEKAMREKRRADLNEDTAREFLPREEGWFSWLSLSPAAWRYAAVAAILLVLCLPALWFGWNPWGTIGHFSYTQGNLIVMNNADMDIHKDTPLSRGVVVQTTRNADCVLSLKKGTEVLVASMSRVVVISPRHVRVDRGKAYFDVTPGRGEFTVEIPGGSVQVLGTSFEVSVDDNQSKVTVTNGKVKVSNERAFITVNPGQSGTIQSMGAPVVQDVPNLNPVMRWVNDLRTQKNQNDLRTYYPSLAVPVPTPGDKK